MRPFENQCDLLWVHADTFRANDVAKVFDAVSMEFAFLGLTEEIVFAKTSKYFTNMFFVLQRVVREDENVVEVDNHHDIEKI